MSVAAWVAEAVVVVVVRAFHKEGSGRSQVLRSLWLAGVQMLRWVDGSAVGSKGLG